MKTLDRVSGVSRAETPAGHLGLRRGASPGLTKRPLESRSPARRHGKCFCWSPRRIAGTKPLDRGGNGGSGECPGGQCRLPAYCRRPGSSSSETEIWARQGRAAWRQLLPGLWLGAGLCRPGSTRPSSSRNRLGYLFFPRELYSPPASDGGKKLSGRADLRGYAGWGGRNPDRPQPVLRAEEGAKLRVAAAEAQASASGGCRPRPGPQAWCTPAQSVRPSRAGALAFFTANAHC